MKWLSKLLPRFLRRALATLLITELQSIIAANVEQWGLAAIAPFSRVLGL